MLHNPLHSLGENSIPPFTDPIQTIEYEEEKIKRIKYHYPKKEDYLIRDLEPLFIEKGVQLVLCGHTHIWNRFQTKEGLHHLETSNVGNSYGAYQDKPRSLVPEEKGEDCAAYGDPNGLLPITPTCKPLDKKPYLSSNTITAFTIFNTESGNIDSYYFDTEKPGSEVVWFDRFSLNL